MDGTLRLLVINKSPKSHTTTNITLNGFTASDTATLFSYGMPQDNAAKNGKGSTDIAQTTISNIGSSFSYKFAPYSVSVLVLSATDAAAQSARARTFGK